MATINPSQDYDAIHTLTFAEASGTCNIRLYRGSTSAYSGTVYYREGTSGSWTQLDVSGTDTTFSVTSTTMQIGHSWNKSGDNYMTPSFYGQSTNLTNISISQKAVLSGSVGTYFMYYYARDCTNLTSLSAPDTSSVTSVGNSFMRYYARGCTNLTSLDVPDTSSVTSVGNSFMEAYAYGCSKLTSLDVPDTSSVTSVGDTFMYFYAGGCTKLTSLILPAVGWFANHDINWSVPSGRLNYLKGYVTDSSDLTDWQDLTTSISPNTLYINYIRSASNVVYIPDALSINKSETVTITDSPTLEIPVIPLEVNESETITITELVTLIQSDLQISKSDSITLTESPVLLLSTPEINVSQSVTVTTSPTVTLPNALTISKSEAVTVTTTLNNLTEWTADVSVNKSDSVTVTTGIFVTLPNALAINKSDSITITETLNNMTEWTSDLSISKSETITVGESLDNITEWAPDLPLVESESISITTTATVVLPNSLVINKSESITVSESLTNMTDWSPDLSVSKLEGVAITDAPTVSVQELVALEIIEADVVTVTDTPNMENQLSGVESYETITVIDSPTVYTFQENLEIDTNEFIFTFESIDSNATIDLLTNDTIVVTDSVEVENCYSVEGAETVTITTVPSFRFGKGRRRVISGVGKNSPGFKVNPNKPRMNVRRYKR